MNSRAASPRLASGLDADEGRIGRRCSHRGCRRSQKPRSTRSFTNSIELLREVVPTPSHLLHVRRAARTRVHHVGAHPPRPSCASCGDNVIGSRSPLSLERIPAYLSVLRDRRAGLATSRVCVLLRRLRSRTGHAHDCPSRRVAPRQCAMATVIMAGARSLRRRRVHVFNAGRGAAPRRRELTVYRRPWHFSVRTRPLKSLSRRCALLVRHHFHECFFAIRRAV